jgi:hypothetical protein
MTNKEILQFAASMNYAQIVIDSSCRIRCGRDNWHRRLPELTDAERGMLVQRIERWQEMVKREVGR